VLARTPLAELLAALLAAPPPASARARGMCCRLVSPAEGPPLAPVSSRGGDVALALLLLLVGAALNDEESSWQEIGLEGVAQQVGGALALVRSWQLGVGETAPGYEKPAELWGLRHWYRNSYSYVP
jgi:hypothetical protein